MTQADRYFIDNKRTDLTRIQWFITTAQRVRILVYIRFALVLVTRLWACKRLACGATHDVICTCKHVNAHARIITVVRIYCVATNDDARFNTYSHFQVWPRTFVSMMLLLMLLLLRYRVFPAYQHSHQQSCTLVVSYLFHTCTLLLVFAHSGTTKKSALVDAEHVARWTRAARHSCHTAKHWAEVISLLYRSLVSPATHSDSPEIGPASTTCWNQTWNQNGLSHAPWHMIVQPTLCGCVETCHAS